MTTTATTPRRHHDRSAMAGGDVDVRFDPDLSDADIRHLSTRRPFRDLDAGQLGRTQTVRDLIRDHVRMRRFDAGQTIIRRHDYGASAFVVLAGRIDIGGGRDAVSVGDLIGEIAATYRTPHESDAVAGIETLVAEVRWQGLKIMRRDRRFGDALDARGWLEKTILHARDAAESARRGTRWPRSLPENILSRFRKPGLP